MFPFELSFRSLIVVLIVVWLIWFNNACTSVMPEIGPIKVHSFKRHSTKGAYGAKSKTAPGRIYLIAGGSGFIGSWIARYLLSRGEKVMILDIDRPPADVLKYGAVWVSVDLTFSFGVKNEINRIRDSVSDDTNVIVYNCSVRKRYELPNFRADLGVSVAENLYIALSNFNTRRVYIIHVSDSLSHREPIKNEDRLFPTEQVWCQKSAAVMELPDDTKDKDRAFSSYAWHQLQVENLTLKVSSENPAIAGGAVLRVDGVVSGHLGDGFFTPMLRSGYVVVHSPLTPLTIVNVEDVARACLSLEYQLLDPNTRGDTDGRSFVVGSTETTTLKQVFKYIQQKRQPFFVIRVAPALVYAATWLMSLVYTGKPVAKRGLRDHMLRLTPSSLTFARFYSCQIGQVPNLVNERHQKEVLALKNNYTLSDTLDSLLTDLADIEKLEKEGK